ncbi:hypothetical protein C8Q77DRAFT_1162322 [Trametes polyzona]|nr:hypothetical protein C8Q77DRAFT_1162322 [Trametes polyzona]
MTSLPHLLKVPSLDSSLGAVLLGVVLGSMLYGLTLHQTYRYFELYPTDKLYLKILVLTILALETVHTVVWIIVVYHYAVTDAFDLVDILRMHWSVRLTFLVTGVAVLVCQSFYAYRVFLVGRHYRWLVIPAVLTILTGFAFALAAGIRVYIIAPYIVDTQHISWLVSVAYGIAVSTDVMLTSALVFVLYQFHTPEAMVVHSCDPETNGAARCRCATSNSVLDTLIIYAVNTGFVTSVFSIVAFVFALIVPGNLIYAAVSIVGTKLYANSVLALLNSRKSIDKQFRDDFTTVHFQTPASDESSQIGVPARAPGPGVRGLTYSKTYSSTFKGSGSIRSLEMSFASPEEVAAHDVA